MQPKLLQCNSHSPVGNVLPLPTEIDDEGGMASDLKKSHNIHMRWEPDVVRMLDELIRVEGSDRVLTRSEMTRLLVKRAHSQRFGAREDGGSDGSQASREKS